jgi:hypothetical protein
MLNWQDVLARQERHQDLLREAEQERLVRQMVAGRDRFYSRALAWLGRQLVAWGWRLQQRCSTCPASPTCRAANQAR